MVLERDRLTSGTTWHAAGLMTCFGSTSETTHRDPALLPRPLRPARGRDRPVDRVQAGRADRGRGRRGPAPRVPPGRGVPAPPRPRGRRDLAAGDVRPVPVGQDRRPARRLPRARRRPGQPGRPHQSLARGAKNLGVRVVEGVRVDGVLRRAVAASGSTGGRRTDATGDIECEYVVNCTGMWARELGERSGVVIPNQAAEHYYLITDTIDGHRPGRADLRGPRGARLLPRGGRRHDGRPLRAGPPPWSVDGHPADRSFTDAHARLGPDGAVPRDARWRGCRSRSRSGSARSSAAPSPSPPT